MERRRRHSPEGELPSYTAAVSEIVARSPSASSRALHHERHDDVVAELRRRVDELESDLREQAELAQLDLDMERRYSAELEATIKVRAKASCFCIRQWRLSLQLAHRYMRNQQSASPVHAGFGAVASRSSRRMCYPNGDGLRTTRSP